MSEKIVDKQNIFRLFAESFGNFSALAGRVENSFFQQAMYRELAMVLESFIRYGKKNSVESRTTLYVDLEKLTELLAVLRPSNERVHFETALCEKSLLLFRKALLEQRTAIVLQQSTVPETKTVFHDTITEVPLIEISAVKKEILDEIRRGGRVLNQDIFKRFSDISTRTLKRHLSDLITSGHIGRYSEGKRVYYIVTK